MEGLDEVHRPPRKQRARRWRRAADIALGHDGDGRAAGTGRKPGRSPTWRKSTGSMSLSTSRSRPQPRSCAPARSSAHRRLELLKIDVGQHRVFLRQRVAGTRASSTHSRFPRSVRDRQEPDLGADLREYVVRVHMGGPHDLVIGREQPDHRFAQYPRPGRLREYARAPSHRKACPPPSPSSAARNAVWSPRLPACPPVRRPRGTR